MRVVDFGRQEGKVDDTNQHDDLMRNGGAKEKKANEGGGDWTKAKKFGCGRWADKSITGLIGSRFFRRIPPPDR